MKIQNFDYEPMIGYFKQFECGYIKWILVIIQIHYFLLNGYLLLSNNIKNYYQNISNNNLNKILDKLRDYILFAMFEQIYINSLKNILECYFDFNLYLSKIFICLIYGIFSSIFMCNRNFLVILLQIIFSFSILMIYYDFDELTRLHINMFVNTIYFLMYILTYTAIYSHKIIETNSKLTKNE